MAKFKTQQQEQAERFMWLTVIIIVMPVVAGITFLVCTFRAISLYEDYSWTENFLSDLGQDKFDHQSLFNGSLVFVGIVLIPLFIYLPIIDVRRSRSMIIASIAGAVSSLGLILLGCLPCDTYVFEHFGALMVWSLPMLLMVIAFYLSAANNPETSTAFVVANFVVVMVMLISMIMAQVSNPRLMQIVIVGYSFVWIGAIVWFAYRSAKVIFDSIDPEAKTLGETADDYADVIRSARKSKR